MRSSLKELHNLRIDLHQIGEKCRIAHLREAQLLFSGAEAGKVVGLLMQKTNVIVLRLLRERCVCDKASERGLGDVIVFAFAVRDRMGIDHGLVGSKGFFVEEDVTREATRRIKLLVEILRVA